MNKNFNTLSLYNINKKKNASKKDNSKLVLLLYVIAHTFNLLMYLLFFVYGSTQKYFIKITYEYIKVIF